MLRSLSLRSKPLTILVPCNSILRPWHRARRASRPHPRSILGSYQGTGFSRAVKLERRFLPCAEGPTRSEAKRNALTAGALPCCRSPRAQRSRLPCSSHAAWKSTDLSVRKACHIKTTPLCRRPERSAEREATTKREARSPNPPIPLRPLRPLR